ncbi:MAG TPA: carbohydrate kinase family protein [Bryobacteraceae bacterium]|nr:carbohydrate kinase family protein [Bryobacteraceae bacterium]
MFDILVRPVEDLVWNRTRWVDSIDTAMGGNGANTAIAAALLGVPVRLIAPVGNDDFGQRALEPLRAAGVDLSLLRRVEAATPTTVVLVRANGDRMFLHQPGASTDAFAEPLEFPSSISRGAGYFHLGNPFALPNMRGNAAATMRNARLAGLVASLDTGWDSRGRWLQDLGGALPHTDLLFVNEDEALHLSGCAGYRDAAMRLRELGASTVIVKRGASGCAVFGEACEFETPAFAVEAVDTTGAGDCFAGGYLAALARGASQPEAARIANAAGALNVQHMGAIKGLKSWDETMAWMESAPLCSLAGA